MRRVGAIGAAFFLSAVLASGQGVPAQDRSRDLQGPLRHQVTVTLKLIQVFVADASGKPAMDLEMADFVLRDNGVLQTITEFEKHVLAVPAEGRAEAAPVTSAPPAKAPDREAEPLLARKFIFLIDYQRNELEGIGRAKRAILEFLETKPRPGDQAALYTFSVVGGLKLHVGLTTDLDLVRAAVEKLRDIPGITPSWDDSAFPDHEPMGMELMSSELFSGLAGGGAPLLRGLFEEVALWAKTLRSVPGPKNIILYSRGFGRGLADPRNLGHSAFEAMARELAAANARIFAVNTTTGFADKVALGVLPEESLDHLARTTGGEYFGDVNFSTRIAADIQDATANYYVLGFSVPAAWDGKYHTIEVEVRRRGFEVRAQRGYTNPLPFGELSDLEKHLRLLDLVSGGPPSADRVLEFPLALAPFAAAGGVNALLVSEIAVEAVREAVGERTEFVILVLNADKAIVDGRRMELDWGSFAAGRVVQYAGLALAPGRYDAWAVIRNLEDGRAAVGTCAVDVPDTAAEGPLLFPPLLLSRGPAAKYLNVLSEKQAGADGSFSLFRIFPFPAKEYAPLVGALARGTSAIGAVLRFEWRAERRGEIEIAARLVAEDGGEEAEIVAEILDWTSDGEADIYLLGVGLPDLGPGRYRLEIEAESEGAGATARASARFAVR
jgi:VWFA-related protein